MDGYGMYGGGGSGFAPMGAPLSSGLMSPVALPPPRPSPQMVMLLAAVKQARLYAIAAVQADNQGDYASAAANYRAAVQSLKNEVANVPPEDAQAFNDRVCGRHNALAQRSNLIVHDGGAFSRSRLETTTDHDVREASRAD